MSRETAEEKGKTGEREAEENRNEKEKEIIIPPQKVSEGVNVLLGDPKKAVLKLSIPIIVAMSVQTIYSLTDTFWVAGLGADALAAVGFAFPFFVIQMALTSGIGVGGGAAISRRIGARDKAGADNVAVHTFVIMLTLTVALTVIGLAVVRDLFMYSGAGETTPLGVAYARVIFAGSFVFFFTNVANSILRSEGDSKRAMQSMVLGSVLNIFLDPVFIYVLGMGVAGAAFATVVSFASSGMLMFYWFFIKKNTYISFVFRSFKFNRAIVKDIFRVGIPSSIEQVALALTALTMNFIIVTVSDTDGVAVYATAWRITSIAVAPLIGIAISVVSVSGAAFGERNFKKARSALIYATKTGFLVEAVIAVAVFIFAPDIAAAFTQAEDTALIAPELTRLLKIMTVFYPAVAFGMLSASLFQGAGKGTSALVATLLRSLVLTPLFALLFAYEFGWGLLGVWWGLVMGTVIGSLVTFVWAQFYLRCMIKTERMGGKC
ncbi:MATE family efflux transporter [Methanosarcina sp. DH2]|jgi:putative MATE family efflux protein|uniref:MATE family efflux transporter n=1 Tax=Methanosarcina sp. DH2 TaxID=2605639 RepID=UPI001E29BDB2|nr:MATE family efflux transporter [Methanosarcina sp. DH2]MCC4770938.1 MATE family efflux transporter [Methanosarcina sp. DH2]